MIRLKKLPFQLKNVFKMIEPDFVNYLMSYIYLLKDKL